MPIIDDTPEAWETARERRIRLEEQRQAEAGDRVNAFMDAAGLTPREASVWWLHVGSLLSLREVARLIGCTHRDGRESSSVTVRRLYAAGREKLVAEVVRQGLTGSPLYPSCCEWPTCM